ncbi:MAG: anhydro-N-acetylmuramic acid kinase [Flavitalea sp.]
MVYRAVGIMSGSSLDGLDIAFVELQQGSGKWTYELKAASCYPYSPEWTDKLRYASTLLAREYLELDAAYGHYIAEQVNHFIQEHQLHYQVQLIASHGHTVFHVPSKKITSQIGNGAAIAAGTGINVVSDLRSMDIAFGGQGAPIVPIGEQLLLSDYRFFLNLGGIANISLNDPSGYIAYDVCPANRVLNQLSAEAGKPFDDGGQIAEKGSVIPTLLARLNALDYYGLPYPKSLSNDFGTDIVYPMITAGNNDIDHVLRTYIEHISQQIAKAAASLQAFLKENETAEQAPQKMLVTGGGAHNHFLVERLKRLLQPLNIMVEVPGDDLVNYKEAIIMALIGVLRWREENNTIASVTGASRNSIGGAVWIGQEA